MFIFFLKYSLLWFTELYSISADNASVALLLWCEKWTRLSWLGYNCCIYLSKLMRGKFSLQRGICLGSAISFNRNTLILLQYNPGFSSSIKIQGLRILFIAFIYIYITNCLKYLFNCSMMLVKLYIELGRMSTSLFY